MYRIINVRGGAEIGCTEKPFYIVKKESTGCFIAATEAKAQGVAYKSTAYNLSGREGVGAEETVALVEFDSGDTANAAAELSEREAQNRADIDFIAMETGVELE